MTPGTVTPLGRARFRIEDGERARVAYAVTQAGNSWVFLDGMVYVVASTPEGPARRRSPATDDVALAAPMPATVVAVNVVPGQRVTQGEVMIQLEAMKMELPIKAPRDAVVASVGCRAGELVQPGIPLVELE